MALRRRRLVEPLDRVLRRMERDPQFAKQKNEIRVIRESSKGMDQLSAKVDDMLKKDGSAELMYLSAGDGKLGAWLSAAVAKLWANRQQILEFILLLFKTFSALPVTQRKK